MKNGYEVCLTLYAGSVIETSTAFLLISYIYINMRVVKDVMLKQHAITSGKLAVSSIYILYLLQ